MQVFCGVLLRRRMRKEEDDEEEEEVAEPVPDPKLATVHMQRALRLQQRNRLEEAVAHYEQSILLHGASETPADRQNLHNKLIVYGEALLWLNRTEAARAVIQTAVTSGALPSAFERPATYIRLGFSIIS